VFFHSQCLYCLVLTLSVGDSQQMVQIAALSDSLEYIAAAIMAAGEYGQAAANNKVLTRT